ncbi:MAG: ROK family protein [Candidatus Hydrothermarchaeales archaeon]
MITKNRGGKSSNRASLLVGLDIGGTNIRGVLLTSNGEVVEKVEESVEGITAEAITEQLILLIQRLIGDTGQKDIRGIGLGVAGLMDFERGVMLFSPHLPLKNVALREIIRRQFELPTFMDNDANAAALGEKYYGAGKEASNFVYLGIGTGIGSGIVIDGGVYRGNIGSAAEFGHTIIDVNGPRCECGNKGCFEALASGPAIAKMAQERAVKDSLLMGMAGGNVKNITAPLVTEAARRGDALSRDVFTEVGGILGIGLANIINILDPELIIIGGGVAEAGELILGPARKTVSELALVHQARDVKIVLAELGVMAGAIGAATLAMEELRQRHFR